MARRPLFCKTCSELLDQLTKATEAVTGASPCLNPEFASDQLQAALEAWTNLRMQYLRSWERARRHLESGHGRLSEPCTCRAKRWPA